MRLTRPQLSWIWYDVAASGFTLIVRTAFAPLFFKKYVAADWEAAFADSIWGYVSAGAGLLAALLVPWLGSIADAISGRKRFLGGFLALGVIATLLLCFPGKGDATLMLALYFLALISYMASNSFYDALLPDVASRGASDRISSLSGAWGYIGSVFPFLICLGVSLVCKDNTLFSVRFAFFLTALWWLALSLPLFRNVRERKRPDAHRIGALDGFRKLWNTARQIRHHREAAIFLLAYFLYIDGVGTILLMATPISVTIGIPDSWLLLTILGLQFIAFPFTILYGVLAQKFGTRSMLYTAIAVYIVIAGMVGLIPCFESAGIKRGLFLTAAFLIGTSQGGVQALSRSFFLRLIPRNQAAEFFGLYNIFGKFTTIFGPILVGLAGYYFRHSEIGIAMLAIPFLLGGLLLSKVRPPSSRRKEAA